MEDGILLFAASLIELETSKWNKLDEKPDNLFCGNRETNEENRQESDVHSPGSQI